MNAAARHWRDKEFAGLFVDIQERTIMGFLDLLNSYGRLCDKGIQARRASNYPMAIDFFLQATKRNSKAARAYGGLAFTCLVAMNHALALGDTAKATQLGEGAILAFDDYIQKEANPKYQAEGWFQKGRIFGDLGRTAERDASWRNADKLVPGYSANRKSDLSQSVSVLIEMKVY